MRSFSVLGKGFTAAACKSLDRRTREAPREISLNQWFVEKRCGNRNWELFLTIQGTGTLSCPGPRCVCVRSGGVGLYSGVSGAVVCFQGDPGFLQHLLEFIFPYCSGTAGFLSLSHIRANSCGNFLLGASWHRKESKCVRRKQLVGPAWRRRKYLVLCFSSTPARFAGGNPEEQSGYCKN